MASSPLVAAALRLASFGYTVVPVSRERKPVARGWPDATPAAHDTLPRFDRSNICGLAVVMQAPLFVVDLDRGHADGVDGVASFHELVRRHSGDVPTAPRVRSRRGGLHLYFRAPTDTVIRSSASALAPGIDIKGARSCAVAPPTPGYRWIEPPCPVHQVPVAPGWLIDLVTARPLPPQPSLWSTLRGNGDRWAQAALAGETKRVATSAPGARNVTLFKAAARLGSLCAAGLISYDAAARELLAAAQTSGLTRDDGAAQVNATIGNGLRTGAKTPAKVRSRRSAHD